jgi:hypothetical protein
MGSLRALVRSHAVLAALILALALGLRALVPAGYMVASGPVGIVLTLCPDAGAAPLRAVASPAHAHAAHAAVSHADHAASGADERQANGGQPCPYGVLGLASLAGADPLLLALALAFAVALGFAARPAPTLRADRFLRPPLRGPPASA